MERIEAKLMGLTRYFTGRPCLRGHISERLTVNGVCLSCCSEKDKQNWRDPEKRSQQISYRKKWERSKGGIESKRRRSSRYLSSEHGKSVNRARVKRWRSTERGKHLKAEWSKKNETIQVYLRNRLNKAITQQAKVGSAVRDLGCSIEQFKIYIQNKFELGMSWENWGRNTWHLDHIKPLASFDLTDRTQFLKACHYTNYQPLWAVDNLQKGCKVWVDCTDIDSFTEDVSYRS